jgi:hypothetical protein
MVDINTLQVGALVMVDPALDPRDSAHGSTGVCDEMLEMRGTLLTVRVVFGRSFRVIENSFRWTGSMIVTRENTYERITPAFISRAYLVTGLVAKRSWDWREGHAVQPLVAIARSFGYVEGTAQSRMVDFLCRFYPNAYLSGFLAAAVQNVTLRDSEIYYMEGYRDGRAVLLHLFP